MRFKVDLRRRPDNRFEVVYAGAYTSFRKLTRRVDMDAHLKLLWNGLPRQEYGLRILRSIMKTALDENGNSRLDKLTFRHVTKTSHISRRGKGAPFASLSKAFEWSLRMVQP